MERLTINKKDNDYDYVTNELELVKKLGQKEDDDEMLSIDSHIVFKVLENGIWYKKGTEIKQFVPDDDIHIVLDCNNSTKTINYWILSIININTNEYIDDFFVSDFGKTWSLTREGLEKKC